MTTIKIVDSAAPGPGLIERFRVRPGDPAQSPDVETALRSAIARARTLGAHVHRAEDDESAAWCYEVCDAEGCMR